MDKPKTNQNNNSKEILNVKKSKDSKEVQIVRSCKDCMEFKNENCYGDKNICQDYRPSPSISKEEMERWPDIGDALFIKFNKSNRIYSN